MGHSGTSVTAKKKSDLFPALYNYLDGEWDRHETSDGNISGIVFSNKIFDTEDEALKYLQREVRDKYYWSRQGFACQFREYKLKASKKLEELRKRRDDAYKKWSDFSNYVPHLENKSEFIGCKGCKAKIPTKLFKYNHCPFCNTDLRSETNIKRLETYRLNYFKLNEELENLIKVEQKKNIDKSELCWIAYGEVHC